MTIDVRCFATLAQYLPENSTEYPVDPGETVRSLLVKLGIPEKDVALMFINSARAYFESEVRDGDRVGIFPAVGGG
jgi:sulfur carrier protein ThiS